MALTKIKTSGIADNAITNAKMADDAIDSADFADASIDLAHMSVNSIDSDQYVDGSIDNVHLAGSIAVSKTLLAGGTGLTLSTNTLNVDAAQTQITSVGTLTALTGGTGDLIWDTTTLVVDSSANRVGIGTATPDGTLHAHTATAGSVSADTNADDLVVENSGNGGISILTPDANTGRMYFGSASDNNYVEILAGYNSNSPYYDIYTGGTKRIRFDANSRISLSNNDSGTGNTIFGKSAGASLDAGSNNNVFIGHLVSDATMNDAIENVGIGSSALSALTSGAKNICIGYSAGEVLTTSSSCILIGDRCGDLINNTSADGTVGIGSGALTALTSGANNLCIGSLSGRAITTGGQNVFVGEDTGRDLVTGSGNVAIGTGAADAFEAVESYNIAIGTNSMGAWQEGNGNVNNNICIGTGAGFGGDVGAGGTNFLDNIAIGHEALDSGAIPNSTMQGTIAIGSGAGGGLTSGAGNIAIGYQAGLAVTTGAYNTLIGYQAGLEHETGHRNTVLGYQAMYDNGANSGPASEDDIFIGFQAGSGTWHSSASSKNVGIGNYAMIGAMNGATMNTAIGHDAYKALTTGDENVAVGALAADSYTGGSYNVSLGAYADANGTSGNSNITIGYNAQKSAADSSQQCTLGTTDIGTLRCNQTSISSLSDSRDKTNIVDIPLGLTFINSVRPVAFDWDRRDGSMSGMSDFGFVAQELKVVEDATDYADHMRIVHTDNPDKLEAAPMKMFPILVKAVQELSQQVEDLKKKVG